MICLPIIEWDFRFQRPQQLMRRLASAERRVFYVSGTFRRWGSRYRLEQKADDLFEVAFRGPGRNVYRDEMDGRSRRALARSMTALFAGEGLQEALIVVQLPFWEPLARQLREERGWRIVYDCMDDHSGFSTNTPAMLAAEERLLREADLVLASSTGLERRARERNPRVLLLRNGADVAHFAAVPSRIRGDRPVIGYYGAIADWFDSNLVGELARRRPDWDFVLVGATYSADLSPLSRLPNVSLPGEKPYDEIPAWLSGFDVCIIPFRRTPLTEATNPVKIYEMFAAGKPVVSVPIPEVAAMAPLVRLASTPEDFEREIEASFTEPQELEAVRRRFGAENSWDLRAGKMIEAIAGMRSFPAHP